MLSRRAGLSAIAGLSCFSNCFGYPLIDIIVLGSSLTLDGMKKTDLSKNYFG